MAIYAGNLTSKVLAGLATAAGLEDIDPDPTAFERGITRLLAALRDRDQPMTAMIDALDEAADPADLAGRLLRPLIDRGGGLIRLLLGTRRHLCSTWALLARLVPAVDLDVPATPTRRASPRWCAGHCARQPRPGNTVTFRLLPAAIVERATTAIAEAAGRRFSSPASWLPLRHPSWSCPTLPTQPGAPGCPRPGRRCAKT